MSTVLSVTIHELGHVIAGKKAGGIYKGTIFKWWGAVGVALDYPNKKAIAKGSAGGLIATGLLTIISLPLVTIPVANYLFFINLLLFVSNIIPWRGSDGWAMWHYSRGQN